MITLVAKTLAVLLRILEQCRADIFIMDWENESGGRATEFEAAEADRAREARMINQTDED